ncbi:TIGR03618 family F420-dependent PPOX class oxidoreductase [Schumannella sp. 10F1B-5-1]|uniref:TIGR03618 family F420-dependent PPOX class oxidoreductase n=1 Tax=Schumannella sp. 10F1B-5-1 TaxID=2590780 RepID=UPI001131AC7A|nr:TIGR03618 family F420-dependent PPOX class oxidoreductase [Schumannella sp. 10F1B-5-1]TPW76824.1 TIGR03618 family F420-dependent PPOX class oxidoreductase [Schumannella sp. 10F1B-5-1]
MPALSDVRLGADALTFLSEYHLATLSTFARDGGIHSVAVGFTWDDGTLRVITSGGTQKVLNVLRTGRASICQLDGARWISFAGAAEIDEDAAAVADAERRYAARYREPRPNPERVVLRMTAATVMGSPGMLER